MANYISVREGKVHSSPWLCLSTVGDRDPKKVTALRWNITSPDDNHYSWARELMELMEEVYGVPMPRYSQPDCWQVDNIHAMDPADALRALAAPRHAFEMNGYQYRYEAYKILIREGCNQRAALLGSIHTTQSGDRPLVFRLTPTGHSYFYSIVASDRSPSIGALNTTLLDHEGARSLFMTSEQIQQGPRYLLHLRAPEDSKSAMYSVGADAYRHEHNRLDPYLAEVYGGSCLKAGLTPADFAQVFSILSEARDAARDHMIDYLTTEKLL